MGFWQRYWAAVHESLTDPVGRRGRIQREIAQRQVAHGWLNQCSECTTTYAKNIRRCPMCLHVEGGPRQTQLIKTYNKGDINQTFQQEAAFLAQFGWRVQSQAYGGQKATLGAGVPVVGIGLGVMGGRGAKEMTVIYTRN